MNQQVAATHTVSTGSRDIATNLQQNINDATQQVSSSLRSQRAASISEVNQAQSEHLATRTVTNYNHMRARTQYYEPLMSTNSASPAEGHRPARDLPADEAHRLLRRGQHHPGSS